jgi:preprotein translocase subunit SecF
MTDVAERRSPGTDALGRPVERSAAGRLVEGQTAVDFIGRRRVGLIVSSILLAATVASLLIQGLNLGIDFEGGVSWDVPADSFTIDDAEQILDDNGISTDGARLQERSSEQGDLVKIQVENQPEGVVTELRDDFATAAGVAPDDVNVNLVSASWGNEITRKALGALVWFIVLVTVFISLRFEWRMALAAIIAMVHDVAISVGIYSIFQFIVTPSTVIAFLTILGYSLYDTIVVFDRVKENEARFGAQKPPYADVVNVSMNQVLMRSLTTSFSSMVPVLSLLLIGAGVLGQATLAEFAIALFVGMATGAYSSIFVASPTLWLLKQFDPTWIGTDTGALPGGRFHLREHRDQFATFGLRARAALVDGSLLAAPWLMGQLLLVAGLALDSVIALLLAIVLQLVFGVWSIVAYCRHVSRTGQSWGGAIVGIYVVDAGSGDRISPGRVFGRSLLRIVSVLPLFLGYLWSLWDDRRQTWHDKLARTVVVQMTDAQQAARDRHLTPHAVGDDLRSMVVTGQLVGKRQRRRDPEAEGDRVVDDSADVTRAVPSESPASATSALRHPPRPRKKRRR